MLNERLKSLRFAKGLTLQQVGDFFGISRASVANWESGTNQPDPRKLEKLAETLDTTVEYLVTGQSRGPRELIGQHITRKLPQIENNMKIEASISLRRRDEEVKVHGEPDCCNLG